MNLNQRWEQGRHSYRPAGETIRTTEYEVAELLDDTTPKAFVLEHHYAASYPAARRRFGLHHHGRLVGVAVFSVPCHERVLTNVFPIPALEAVELGRFVLLDEVPGNGETWFLGRAFDQLRRTGIRGIVSFSDPVPRAAADGRVIMPGHVGTIYQAHNAVYLGRGDRQVLRLLPDGSVFHKRAVQKIRKLEKGWRAAVALLEAHGAAHLPSPDGRLEWLETSLARLTRRFRHAGNHKYAWALDRRLSVVFNRRRPYPKAIDAVEVSRR